MTSTRNPRAAVPRDDRRFHLALRTRTALAVLLTTAALGLPTVGAAQPINAAAATTATASAQVPGYYRARIGDLTVTALFDGAVALPRAQLVGVPRNAVNTRMQRRYVPESTEGMQTAVNAYLIQRDAELVLIDAGTAHCFGDALGHVPDNLRASGLRPEDVTAVLLTHAHPDHLCGVLDTEGRMQYPNATLWLSETEADYWQNADNAQNVKDDMRPLFGMAQKALAPYQAAGKLRRFGAQDALPLAARAVATHGHTPGHTSFRVDGGDGQSLLIWGDVLHYHAVQFALPQASYEVDVNRAQAVEARRRVLAQAADGAWWVAGAHLPFPGIGHVRREGRPGEAFSWVPAEFSPLLAKP